MLVVFVILAAGSLLGLNYLYNHPDSDGYVRIPRIAIALPVLGVLGVILAVYNLLSPTKGLTLSDAGINYNVGMHKFGPVTWAEISGVAKKRYMMNDFVVVDLHNPAGFIKSRGFWTRRLYKENHNAHGSPMVIIATQLTVSPDELVAEIHKHIPGGK